MGNRENRRKPTRAEKIKNSKNETAKRGTGATEKNKPQTRRVSPKALELGRAYAKCMGWPLERVIPPAECH